jgi:hypothetical protein
MSNQTSQTARPEPPPDEYANFKKGLKHLLSVPKTEIDRREKEWKAAQDAKPKRGPKPKQ